MELQIHTRQEMKKEFSLSENTIENKFKQNYKKPDENEHINLIYEFNQIIDEEMKEFKKKMFCRLPELVQAMNIQFDDEYLNSCKE